MRRADERFQLREHLVVLVGGVLFLLGFYVIAPLIHEAGHILMLKYYNCRYVANLDIILLRSFYGKIYEACDLTKVQQLLVYLGGIILTFTLGFVLMILDIFLTRKRRVNTAILFAALAMSFFLNTSVYFFQDEGDVVYALQALGLHENVMPAVKLTGIGILGLMLLLLGISLYHDVQLLLIEWEEKRDEWEEYEAHEEKLSVWFMKNIEKIKNKLLRSSRQHSRRSRAKRR